MAKFIELKLKLTEDIDTWITAKVASGAYNTANDLVLAVLKQISKDDIMYEQRLAHCYVPLDPNDPTGPLKFRGDSHGLGSIALLTINMSPVRFRRLRTKYDSIPRQQ